MFGAFGSVFRWFGLLLEGVKSEKANDWVVEGEIEDEKGGLLWAFFGFGLVLVGVDDTRSTDNC